MRNLCDILRRIATALMAFLAVGVSTYGQEAAIVDVGDTVVQRIEPFVQRPDSFAVIDGEIVKIITSYHVGEMGHNPHTATMYAAVLPGLGQIYNKKYWKLPLLYGGAAALIYAIHFNNKYYKIYRNAYRDFVIGDPNNKSYMSIIERSNLTEELIMSTYSSWFQTQLENKKDYYRRYRDLSIFGMIALYCVQIVDACVDAHFFNFDVSDDLSVHWVPTASPKDGGQVGAAFAINF